MSEASIRTQWKKGQSGNPKGRPKKPKLLTAQGEMLTYMARFVLDQPAYIFGRSEPITRQARLMMDIAARAENGDYKAARFLLDLADRGDRRRLQALRLAQCAKTKRAARFERRNADKISPRTPGLRPDQEHLIMPAREIRTEQLKPLKFAAKKRGYEFDHWHDPDPLAGIPKHLTQAEREARDEKFRSSIEAAARAPSHASVSTAQESHGAGRAPVSETEPKAAAKSPPEAGVETAVKTGPITGVITGLENARRAHQTIDAARESETHISASKNFAIPLANIDGASVNGGHMNGSHG